MNKEAFARGFADALVKQAVDWEKLRPYLPLIGAGVGGLGAYALAPEDSNPLLYGLGGAAAGGLAGYGGGQLQKMYADWKGKQQAPPPEPSSVYPTGEVPWEFRGRNSLEDDLYKTQVENRLGRWPGSWRIDTKSDARLDYDEETAKRLNLRQHPPGGPPLNSSGPPRDNW